MINFNSGPSFVPDWVRQEAIKAINDLNGSGLSIFEIGHRTAQYQDIADEVAQRTKQLMSLSDDYEVILLQGGATQQFAQIPYNFLSSTGKALYIQTGSWSEKAAKEAKHFGDIVSPPAYTENQLLAIPPHIDIPASVDYVHLTSNETITGTQWKDFSSLATTIAPLLVDVSSDVFSRRMDFGRFDFIYFGAQKNVGIAGTTIVVAKKTFLATAKKDLVISSLSFHDILGAKGIPNTPAVFAVYVAMLMLRWIEKEGGLAHFEQMNRAKAKLIYDIVDAEPLFVSHIHPSSRSEMNIPFFIADKALEQDFLDRAEKEGFYGIRGHRTAGGIRVSLYNATSMEKVQSFASFMKKFVTNNK